MGKFNIVTHILDHAAYLHNLDESYIHTDTRELLHFNISFHDFLFKDEQDEVERLKTFIHKAIQPTIIEEKNGFYKRVDGTLKQKYTKRALDLSDASIAIHIVDDKGQKTYPHIHFLFNVKKKLGNAYSTLKIHLSNIACTMGLMINMNKITSYNPKSVLNLQRGCKRFSWMIKKATARQLHKMLDKQDYVTRRLDGLYNLTDTTRNLSFLVKTMNHLKKRLNHMHRSFIYQEHDLKESYPIPLSQEDHKVIELVTTPQKLFKKHLRGLEDNLILQDYVRYSEDKKAYIIDALRNNKGIVFYKNHQKASTIKEMVLGKLENDATKDYATIQEERTQVTFKSLFRNVFHKALTTSKSEVELRECMLQHYSLFSKKKINGKWIGYTTQDANEKKIVVKFDDLHVTSSQILYKLSQNSKVQEKSLVEAKNHIEVIDVKEAKPREITQEIFANRTSKNIFELLEEANAELRSNLEKTGRVIEHNDVKENDNILSANKKKTHRSRNK